MARRPVGESIGYMERYTLSLALFDYLPVLAGSIAIFLICKYCATVGQRSGVWLVAIPLLAVVGGFLKATWKTIYVTTGHDLNWMSDQLFFFLASSYIFVTGLVISALGAAAKNQSLEANWWRLPLAIAIAVVSAALYLIFTSDSRAWTFVLLAVMSIANLVFMIRLIIHAKSLGNWPSVVGFAVGLTLTYILVGLARIEEQTLELQWTEEVLNLIAQSMTASAAWSLYQAHQSRITQEHIPETP